MRFLTRIPGFLIALLLIGAALCIRPVSDTDILWHIRAGQWMLAHGDVIRQDIFSVTRWGCPWISVPWLYEVLLARLQATWGWLGPTFLQMGFVIAIILQTAVLIRLQGRRAASGFYQNRSWAHPPLSAMLAMLLTLYLLQMRINHRPEMSTYLLTGTYLIILTLVTKPRDRPHHKNTSHTRLLWLLPILQVGWTNLHGVFILGPLLVGGFAVGAWISVMLNPVVGPNRLRVTSWTALNTTLAALLTALACFITPYGATGALYPVHLFSVLTDPVYKNAILEGRPLSLSLVFSSNNLGYPLIAAWGLTAIGLLGRLTEKPFAVAIQEIGPGYLGCCAALTCLSFTAIRNVPLMPLAAAPWIANGLDYAADSIMAVAGGVWGRLRGRDDGDRTAIAWLRGRSMSIVARVLLALALVLTYRAIVSERFYNMLGWRTRFALGFSSHEHPLAACNFLAKQASTNAWVVYGDTRSANTLLWRFGPEWKTYFDGRHAEIYDPAIFQTAVRTRSEPALFLKEAGTYGIGLVCFSFADRNDNLTTLSSFLYQPSNHWSLIYLDDCAAVFAADALAGNTLTNRFALPQPPSSMDEQRAAFDAWLAGQGRPSLAAFDDPVNDALERTPFATGLMRAMQLGGLWSATRHVEAMRYCRLSAFLDCMGWKVVADDLYLCAMSASDAWPVVLPRAIRHAIALHRETTDPALRMTLLARIRARSGMLRDMEPGSLFAAYGQAYLDEAENRHANAIAILEPLLVRNNDTALFDLVIQAYLHLAAGTQDPKARAQLCLKAVHACRARLALSSSDPHAGDVHGWLAECARNLHEPLVARANERLATNTTHSAETQMSH